MATFNSYVELPEGIPNSSNLPMIFVGSVIRFCELGIVVGPDSILR